MLEGGDAAGGGSDHALRAELERLSLELQEANEEKLQAARYGLAVLEESAALRSRHSQLEEELEVLRREAQQLREVSSGGSHLRPCLCQARASCLTLSMTSCLLYTDTLKLPRPTTID